MGKTQSKRSVDITTEGGKTKGAEDDVAVTGKLEKIEDVDQQQKQLNGDAANQSENNEAEKKDVDESENDKDLTTEKSGGGDASSIQNGAGDANENGDQSKTSTATASAEASSDEAKAKETDAGAAVEDISPLADESMKKSKKEKVKKKWSFRSISFGKKDKQKPTKTEETNGDSPQEKTPVDNPETGAADIPKATEEEVTAANGTAVEQQNGNASDSNEKKTVNGGDDATSSTEQQSPSETAAKATTTPTTTATVVPEETTVAAAAADAVAASAAVVNSSNDAAASTAIENSTVNDTKATIAAEVIETNNVVATENTNGVNAAGEQNGLDAQKIVESVVAEADADKVVADVVEKVESVVESIATTNGHQNGTTEDVGESEVEANAKPEAEAVAELQTSTEQSKSQIEVNTNTPIDDNTPNTQLPSSHTTTTTTTTTTIITPTDEPIIESDTMTATATAIVTDSKTSTTTPIADNEPLDEQHDNDVIKTEMKEPELTNDDANTDTPSNDELTVEKCDDEKVSEVCSKNNKDNEIEVEIEFLGSSDVDVQLEELTPARPTTSPTKELPTDAIESDFEEEMGQGGEERKGDVDMLPPPLPASPPPSQMFVFAFNDGDVDADADAPTLPSPTITDSEKEGEIGESADDKALSTGLETVLENLHIDSNDDLITANTEETLITATTLIDDVVVNAIEIVDKIQQTTESINSTTNDAIDLIATETLTVVSHQNVDDADDAQTRDTVNDDTTSCDTNDDNVNNATTTNGGDKCGTMFVVTPAQDQCDLMNGLSVSETTDEVVVVTLLPQPLAAAINITDVPSLNINGGADSNDNAALHAMQNDHQQKHEQEPQQQQKQLQHQQEISVNPSPTKEIASAMDLKENAAATEQIQNTTQQEVAVACE